LPTGHRKRLPIEFCPGDALWLKFRNNAVKSRANNFQELVDEVCDLNSQVVLLEDSARLNGRNSPAQLLMSNPGLKIIVVLRESNYIHIFRKEEIMIQSSSDLIEAIQSN